MLVMLIPHIKNMHWGSNVNIMPYVYAIQLQSKHCHIYSSDLKGQFLAINNVTNLAIWGYFPTPFLRHFQIILPSNLIHSETKLTPNQKWWGGGGPGQICECDVNYSNASLHIHFLSKEEEKKTGFVSMGKWTGDNESSKTIHYGPRLNLAGIPQENNS